MQSQGPLNEEEVHRRGNQRDAGEIQSIKATQSSIADFENEGNHEQGI